MIKNKNFSVNALRLGLLTGVVISACPAFAQGGVLSKDSFGASADGQTAAAKAAGGVEEIVVTAQKREQNLQTVPISITALSGDTIRANRIQDVRDLSAIAPNLTVRQGSGGANYVQYTLRGIYTPGATLGVDRGVSLYIDGVYLQNLIGSIFELADIERIEVLKGPQGTLFGRNATGGAVSLITRDPTGVLGGRQDFSVGTLDTFRSKTHIDLPKFGPISASFTYLHSQNRGDTRNLGAGTVWDYGPATGGALGKYTSPKYLGDSNTNAVFAAVKLDLHPDLDIVYKFDYAKNHFTPQADGIAYLPGIPGSNDGVPVTLLGEIYAASRAAGVALTPISRTRPDAVNNNFAMPGVTTNQGHNLTARYRLNDTISFKNIAAYRKSNTLVPGNDLGGLGGLLNIPVSLAPLGAPVVTNPSAISSQGLTSTNPNAPYSWISNSATDRQTQFSDEFQMNITTEWFNLTAGALHFHNHQAYGQIPGTFNSITLGALAGQRTSAAGTNYVIPSNPGGAPSTITLNSDAVFVQPEIHLTDRLDIVGGARITRDRKDGLERVPYPLSAIAKGLATSNVLRYRDSEATYLAGVNYKIADRVLAYAKFSTGYISGGELATVAFRPEFAKSWEAGIKAELFDRRLRSNISVFDAKYRNIQFTTSGTLANIASAAAYGVVVISAADAKAYGFEWENTLVPFRGLTLTGNIGYTHFNFIQNTVFAPLAVASGTPGFLTNVRPEWTGNTSVQYETPEIIHGGHAVFRVDADYTGKTLYTNDVSLGNGPTGIVDPNLRTAATARAHFLVNGRIGLTGIEVGRTKLEIAAWGKNLFDWKGITQNSGYDFTSATAVGFAPIGAVGSVLYERQRTIGMDVSVSF